MFQISFHLSELDQIHVPTHVDNDKQEQHQSNMIILLRDCRNGVTVERGVWDRNGWVIDSNTSAIIDNRQPHLIMFMLLNGNNWIALG